MDRQPQERRPSATLLAQQLRSSSDAGAGLDAETLARALQSACPEVDAVILEALGAADRDDPALHDIPLELLADLVQRLTRGLAGPRGARLDAREAAWTLLDRIRVPGVFRRIAAVDRDAWTGRLLGLIEASHYTVGPLWQRRVRSYHQEILFEWSESGQQRSLRWSRAATRVDQFAGALLSVEAERAPIAIFSENRIEMALLDLACLSYGLRNVLVPANASDSDVRYILDHSGSQTVVVGGESQLRTVLAHRERLPGLRRILSFDRVRDRPEVQHLESIAYGLGDGRDDVLKSRLLACRIDDVATVMYTSGTTGTPKAIPFTQRNIVIKRFARGLALPEIGDRDVLLCFLPLFHTFGRFLELLGCVYWGARYCFLESTAPDGLLLGMQRYRPTVFISVPKKWIQLHEQIAEIADPATADDHALQAALRRVTGGRLRWGLSAAGHLDSEIFRLFQHCGVELMSGFGMTEATGGITMTPPGEYRDGSLGVALPGIELALAGDGELLVRGPYVMQGYLDPPAGEVGFDAEGWFHTGDLMQRDEAGHLQLVDRKKEIYKNVKGETIAPQRVENLFREFDSVGRAFLVGDHREYNTLLIYPNPDFRELDLRRLGADEIINHFRSLVVSVNQFLAPYERIVDFALIPRDLDRDQSELTDKGTARRKVVERNFAATIRELYRTAVLGVGGAELTLPNWLFQTLGLTSQDIRIDGDTLRLASSAAGLLVRRVGEGVTRIGSCSYRHERGPLNLGTLLTTPRLWLGNEELIDFAPLDEMTRERSSRSAGALAWNGRSVPYRPRADDRATLDELAPQTHDLQGLHVAAGMLFAEDEQDVLAAVRFLRSVLEHEESPLGQTARLLLRRVCATPAASARELAFLTLVTHEADALFGETLRAFLGAEANLLDERFRSNLVLLNLNAAKLEAWVAYAMECCAAGAADRDSSLRIDNLLAFLAEYGSAHPVTYRRLRAVLVRLARLADAPAAQASAARVAIRLERGFRDWLGPGSRIAVDPETGQEYRWHEVVVFDEDVVPADRQRLLSAIRDTAFINEGVFLFSGGVTVRLSDIPPGGIWIRLLGTRHGKSVYRITVQTRWQGSYDLAANVNHELSAEQVREEIDWLILSGDPSNREPLVEDFGGYWPDQDMWSEEFIAGETLDHAMQRLSRRKDADDRLADLWPFMAWATLSAYTDFWQRSGRRLEIADPGRTNVVVPTEDFQSGVRLVSLSRRRAHGGLEAMMQAFQTEFIEPACREYPQLDGLVGWDVIFSALLEIVGEKAGVALLTAAVRDVAQSSLNRALCEFLAQVDRIGFLPMRPYFAARRYRRWAALSGEATAQARALTLQELLETYGLQELAGSYPELRIRMFLETVFENGTPELREGLSELIRGVRDGRIVPEAMIDAVDELRAGLALEADEAYFLARLSYPYLRPEDDADFVRADLGGKRQSEIVVTLEDDDGRAYRVRHALNPKEIERLYRLFLATKLDVRFGMEHRHLVAIDERGRIIAGIYYELDDETRSAHLEKIVVAERFRRKGVADGLMNEFLNRLRAAGMKTVTTGFFRPEYFYAYGFRIEKRYAGLVKSLEDEPSSTAGGPTGAGRST